MWQKGSKSFVASVDFAHRTSFSNSYISNIFSDDWLQRFCLYQTMFSLLSVYIKSLRILLFIHSIFYEGANYLIIFLLNPSFPLY